jgi:hypothetical protein
VTAAVFAWSYSLWSSLLSVLLSVLCLIVNLIRVLTCVAAVDL